MDNLLFGSFIMDHDLTGLRFGNIVVKDFVRLNGQKRRIWLCLCDCGNTKEIRADALTRGTVTTCGCRNLDLTGQRFGKLFVEKQIGSTKHKRRLWRCRCDCGNITDVQSNYLVNGETRSCGCYKASGDARVTHGYRRDAKNKKQHKVYTAWCNMKHHCYYETDPNYPVYGARGIIVCDKWQDSFENFLADVGEPTDPRYSLERLDVNGNYEPDNVVWASPFVQAINKQETQVEYQDLKDTLKKFCEMTDVDYAEIIARLHSGEPMLPLLG
jgi:hypothetical protein